ncbi:hypothetical protein M3P36_09205 [Altererythrobacter sp. KTW20L]|uniref:hypothetical protein n=1 Tax=Altererythrobacter sp. KTW20L TaxID=2942210 RepID=UPI0020C15BEB|nr:hypothetical protein [Altererythrobacter sp. KTW20L]MCL6251215.1 hypothetical protein [Altererythrobacter sp. KTW20L]
MNRRISFVAAATVLVAGGVIAQAQDTSEADDLVTVGSGDGSGNVGRLAINLAAGDQNQQLSSATLAIGDVAAVGEGAIQRASSDRGDRAAHIHIADDAFSDNSGIISLNITAGRQNQSANLAAFAIGQSGALTDQFLEQSRAPVEPPGGMETNAAAPNDTVEISDDAFGQSSGLFQANLIGGERNSSANTFSLTVSAGGQP